MIELTEKGAENSPKTRYIKIERYNSETTQTIAESVKNMISVTGEDLTRDGIKDTPRGLQKRFSFVLRVIKPIRKRFLKEHFSKRTIRRWFW